MWIFPTFYTEISTVCFWGGTHGLRQVSILNNLAAGGTLIPCLTKVFAPSVPPESTPNRSGFSPEAAIVFGASYFASESILLQNEFGLCGWEILSCMQPPRVALLSRPFVRRLTDRVSQRIKQHRNADKLIPSHFPDSDVGNRCASADCVGRDSNIEDGLPLRFNVPGAKLVQVYRWTAARPFFSEVGFVLRTLG